VFQLQAQANSKILPLNVTPPNLGTDACALLQITGGDSYSVKFTAGDGDITNKTTTEYSHKKVTLEGSCASCSDGIQDQGESGVDCGGPNCAGCGTGETCALATDCLSLVCSGGICTAPTCSDGVQNQGEVGVDCGGPCRSCSCTSTTCAAEGAQCGPIGDGCGNLLQCGSCSAGQTCGGGGPSVCGVGSCTPRTCATQGVHCGPTGDGCGNVLQCGTCPAGQTCGGGGQPSVCG